MRFASLGSGSRGNATLVEKGNTCLLVDCGFTIKETERRLERLGKTATDLTGILVTHEHGDHTAGIPWITEINPSVKCYSPASYAEQLKASGSLPPHSKGIEKPTHLYGPFYSTGDDFVAFREQGLVIKTETGGVLITGCGHPGAVRMIAVAEQELGIEIHTLIGGLHLMSKSEEDLEQIATTLKEMGIKQICPTHCTGDKSIAALKASFGNGYIAGGTGQVITIN